MNRMVRSKFMLFAGLLAGFAIMRTTPAAESSAPQKKIVLIAGTKSHGPGEHEYEKGVKLLKHCLDTSPNVKGVRTEVVLDGWPKDPSMLEDAVTILLYCD